MLRFIENVLWTIISIMALILCLAFNGELTVEELFEMFFEEMVDTWSGDQS